MKERRTHLPNPIGGSSLLVIFSVLCVVIFALLSVSSAQSDTLLNERSLMSITQYYEADSAAEEILAAIRSGEIPEGVSREGDVYSCECAIPGDRTLFVEARVSGEEYEILRWQVCYTEDWETDEFIEVWDGETF